MSWRVVGDNILGLTTKLSMEERTHIIHYRIVHSGPIRVDLKTRIDLPWEAIDQGVPPHNVVSAQILVEEHLLACFQQNTLTPVMDRR